MIFSSLAIFLLVFDNCLVTYQTILSQVETSTATLLLLKGRIARFCQEGKK
jgi:hypothetical protein